MNEIEEITNEFILFSNHPPFVKIERTEINIASCSKIILFLFF
jgi:hypothetical protein